MISAHKKNGVVVLLCIIGIMMAILVYIHTKEINAEDIVDGKYNFSSIPKRFISEPIITDPYCFNTDIDEHPDCICQDGYVKVGNGATYTCIPKSCTAVQGTVSAGDAIAYNFIFCTITPRIKITSEMKDKESSCDMISNVEGRGICLFTYASYSKNRSVCKKISTGEIRLECERLFNQQETGDNYE